MPTNSTRQNLRLTPLRPIGVVEVLHSTAAKIVVTHIRTDIITSLGSMQVCDEQKAGYESIIHAMHAIYEDETCEEVILVNESIAFNSISKKVFLHNITMICPAIAICVKNCYSTHSQLFIIGSNETKSCEEKTQGDPVAIAVYAITVIPMILMIVDITTKIDYSTKTTAYADDIAAAESVKTLVESTLHATSRIWILSRDMVICKRESQKTNIIGLQRYFNKSRLKDNAILE